MENLERAIEQIKKNLPGMTLMENEPMSRHCSFRIGGPVRAFAVPSGTASFTKLCYFLKAEHIAPMVVGNCTNILFPDEGLKDLFIVSTEKMDSIFLTEDGAIYAEAGVSLSKLATFAYQNGLTGLEFASGIPGSVGGGCFMNAGAYGGELKNAVESVVVYYLPNQGLYEYTKDECDFSYRRSVFSSVGGYAILSAVFRLEKGDPEEIAAKMRDFNERRRDKQPLDLPSAGSAFKRPEGHFAAALIDECGLKGYTVGGAQVSEKHAGFIVNKGGAASHDVYELMMHVRNTVFTEKKVQLEPEIIILPTDYRIDDNSPVPPLHNVMVNDFTAEPEKSEV